MPTKTGKPQRGDRVLFDFVILGEREAAWQGTVLSWPSYNRVRIKIDKVLFDPRGHFAPPNSKVATWDEHTAAMYLERGTVKVIDEDTAVAEREQQLVVTYRIPSEAGPAHASHVADGLAKALDRLGVDRERVKWQVPWR